MFILDTALWIACMNPDHSKHSHAKTLTKITDQDVIVVPLWTVFEVGSSLTSTQQATFLKLISLTQNIRVYYPNSEDLKRIEQFASKHKQKSFSESATLYLSEHLGCTTLSLEK